MLEQLARQALKLERRNVHAVCVLADILRMSGRAVEARSLVETQIEKGTAEHELFCRLAWVCLDADDEAAAERAAESAIKTKVTCPHSRHALALLRIKQDRASDAVRYLADAVREAPHDMALLAQYGATLGNAGQVEAAIGCLRRVIAGGLRTPRIYTNLSRLLIASGSEREAMHVSQVATAENPADVRTLVTHGVLLNNVAADPVAAEAQFRQALALDPTDAEALGNLCVVLRRQNRTDEARAIYRLYDEYAAARSGALWDNLSDLAE